MPSSCDTSPQTLTTLLFALSLGFVSVMTHGLATLDNPVWPTFTGIICQQRKPQAKQSGIETEDLLQS